VIGLIQNTVTTDFEYSNNLTQENSSSSYDAIHGIYESPASFFRSIFFNSITAIVTVGGLIAIGAGVLMKSDMVLLSGMLGLFGSLIVSPMQIIWSFMRDELGMMMCPATSVAIECAPANFFSSIILGSLAIGYLMAVVEWWTSRPLTK